MEDKQLDGVKGNKKLSKSGQASVSRGVQWKHIFTATCSVRGTCRMLRTIASARSTGIDPGNSTVRRR